MTKSIAITNTMTENVNVAANDTNKNFKNGDNTTSRKYPSIVKKTAYGHGLFTTTSVPVSKNKLIRGSNCFRKIHWTRYYLLTQINRCPI